MCYREREQEKWRIEIMGEITQLNFPLIKSPGGKGQKSVHDNTRKRLSHGQIMKFPNL